MATAGPRSVSPEDLVSSGIGAQEPVRDPRAPAGFVTWAANGRPAPVPSWLRDAVDADVPIRQSGQPLRLLVEGDVDALAIVPRLLAAPGVGAAVLPATRAPDALRRRAWPTVFGLGVAEQALLQALVQPAHDMPWVPSELVRVTDVRTDPESVGLLALTVPPAEAISIVTAHPCVACAVLCAVPQGVPWDEIAGQLAQLRGLTGAVASAITRQPAALLPADLYAMLRSLTHGHTFDVALTHGLRRDVVLVGEDAALNDSRLPDLFASRARQYRLDWERATVRSTPPPPPATPPTRGPGQPRGPVLPETPSAPTPSGAIDSLDGLSEGAFDFEHGEASTGPHLEAEIEEALASVEEVRLLQATVNHSDGRFDFDTGTFPPEPNIWRMGSNEIRVFLGPREQDALAGGVVSDTALGFAEDPELASVSLTVELVPLEPPGQPQRAELVVPRTGRSPDAVFSLELDRHTTTVTARVVVLHRNRVLQTLILAGELFDACRALPAPGAVGGHGSRRRQAPLRPDVRAQPRRRGQGGDGHPRRRREHDPSEDGGDRGGRRPHPGPPDPTDVDQPAAENQRRILVNVAVEGRSLHGELLGLSRGAGQPVRDPGRDGALGASCHSNSSTTATHPTTTRRSARTGWRTRRAARLLHRRGGHLDRVPAVFWGMSRVIERHDVGCQGRQRVRRIGLTEPQAPHPHRRLTPDRRKQEGAAGRCRQDRRDARQRAAPRPPGWTGVRACRPRRPISSC